MMTFGGILRRGLRFLAEYGPLFFVLGWVALYWFPPDYWMTVDSVQVFNTKVGKSPLMVFIRSVYRPFTAQWTVTVRRADPNSTSDNFTTTCTANGTEEYKPQKKEDYDPKHPDLTLDQWTWPVRCNLTTGQYIVTTVWRIDIPGTSIEKVIHTTSNVFTVSP